LIVGAAAALVTALPCTARAQELRVAAASDLQTVMPQLAERFGRETGYTVTPVFGSSGNFFGQIQNGAPFDLFFSADVDYPRRLGAAGFADPGSLYIYALGRIVLWTRKDSGVDVARGLAALDDPHVRRIAIANPDHAPYGRAAVAALQHERLYDRLKSKLVLGENISQAAQFVQSGAADAGIIALSLTVAPEAMAAGAAWEIPASFHPPIEQAAVVVAKSAHKEVAHQFIGFLQRPEIVRVLADYGFARP
jgi:molybdate transport system substrate-binding protein